MGYSSRYRSPTTWMTARSFPSGDQSASTTPSRISRGVPPAMGARASVPSNTAQLLGRGRTRNASSSRDETARIKASVSPRDRIRGWPLGWRTPRAGCCPSGRCRGSSRRPVRTPPSPRCRVRKVSLWNVGGVQGGARPRPSHRPSPATASNKAGPRTKAMSRRRFGEREVRRRRRPRLGGGAFEGEGEVARGLEAVLGGLLEAAAHDAEKPRRELGSVGQGLRRILAQDRAQGIGGARALERPLAGEHLEEHGAEGEEVRAVIGGEAPHLLGRHVADRAQDRARAL